MHTSMGKTQGNNVATKTKEPPPVLNLSRSNITLQTLWQHYGDGDIIAYAVLVLAFTCIWQELNLQAHPVGKRDKEDEHLDPFIIIDPACVPAQYNNIYIYIYIYISHRPHRNQALWGRRAMENTSGCASESTAPLAEMLMN